MTARLSHKFLGLPLFAGGVVVCLTPSILNAQSVVSGVVVDSAGAPVIGAIVSAGEGVSVSTDEDGKFRLTPVGPGQVSLKARRLGFLPVEKTVQISGRQPVNGVEFRLAGVPKMLSPVLISSSYPQYTGRLAGYYKRLERKSAGHFISRDQIDRSSHRSLSQLIRTVPGINSVPLRAGGNGARMRGRRCRPLVWIDGVPMPAGEVDLDAFPTSTLHGIEMYSSGSATVPSDFLANANMSSCGTILLWSRGPDTDPPTSQRAQSFDLERMIASLKIFSGDQVDKPAVLANADSVDPKYPPELFAGGVTGSVLAEFVVDSTGRVEEETVTIVSSTNSLFSATVLRSLQAARYVPAMKDGRAVRQAVQQPFKFTPPGQRKPAPAGK